MKLKNGDRVRTPHGKEGMVLKSLPLMTQVRVDNDYDYYATEELELIKSCEELKKEIPSSIQEFRKNAQEMKDKIIPKQE